jgi:hypothetical protein
MLEVFGDGNVIRESFMNWGDFTDLQAKHSLQRTKDLPTSPASKQRVDDGARTTCWAIQAEADDE